MELSNKKLTDDAFFAERKEILGHWQTGKDVDFDEAVAYHTDEQAAQRADDAERDHGDDDHGVLHQHERVPDEVAEAVFAREHFAREAVARQKSLGPR